MKRFLIEVNTAWCGEDNTYAAYAETESELWETVDTAAYDNFMSFHCPENILKELFPDVEEYTDEMRTEAAEEEGNYYSGTIIEWDESRPEEEWEWYELIYDGRVLE